MTLSFDELLDLAALKGGPLELEVKALGGRKVYVRNPTSADIDAWRMWANRNQNTGAPMAAKLVSIMLCDEHGDRIVPQSDEALAALAASDPKVIDEIAKFCLPLVNDPGEEGIDAEKND